MKMRKGGPLFLSIHPSICSSTSPSPPLFSTTSFSLSLSVYLTDYYIALGAPLAFLTFFIAVARSMDILVDPVMGNITDRTRTRWGRRRIFTLSGCLFYGVFFFLLFSPPMAIIAGGRKAPPGAPGTDIAPAKGSHMPIVLWFGFFYWLFYLMDSISNVPYEALGPELTDCESERSNLFFISKLFNMVRMGRESERERRDRNKEGRPFSLIVIFQSHSFPFLLSFSSPRSACSWVPPCPLSSRPPSAGRARCPA